MTHRWMREVLQDLQIYAISNNLPNLVKEFEGAIMALDRDSVKGRVVFDLKETAQAQVFDLASRRLGMVGKHSAPTSMVPGVIK